MKVRQRIDHFAEPASPFLSTSTLASTPSEMSIAPRSSVPRLNAKLVTRARLLSRIDQSTSCPLTVVMAPAGFGKTTLLATWARQTDRCVAWISADEHEGTIVDLLNRIAVAVAEATGQAPESELRVASLQKCDEAPDALIATRELIRKLHNVTTPTTIIIDDYYLLKDSAVHQGIVELVESLDEHINLVISTRSVPPLPLTKMRARGILRQIDAEQLRFAELECAEFLLTTMGLNLTHDEVNRLTSLMEGWIVGLQLAAIDIQEGAIVDEVVKSARRPERHALTFLLEEVLDRQPVEVQRFLLQTSVLETMSAQLCNYVTQASNSEQILAKLRSENLFIVSLDDTDRWVRYQHIFRSLLQERLEATSPELVQELNKRASRWHAENRMLPEAVSYSLVASDWMTMSDMMQRVGAPHLLETKAFRDWLRALPREAFIEQPKLSSWMAWTCIAAADIKGFNRLLELCNDNLTTNVAEFAMMKALISCLSLDGSTALFYARKALDLTQASPVYKALALATVGVAQRILGKPVAAQASFIEAVETARLTGPATMNVMMRYETYLGHAQSLQGRLDQALETIDAVQEKAVAAGVSVPPTVPIYRSRIYYARNQHDLAHAELVQALDVTRKTGIEMNTPILWLTIAMNHAGLGDITRAMTTLDELIVWLRRNGNSGYIKSAETLRYQLLLRQGHIDTVGSWLKVNSSYDPKDFVYSDHDRYVLNATWAYYESNLNSNDAYLSPAIALIERMTIGAQNDGRLIDLGREHIVLSLLKFEQRKITDAANHLNIAASSLLPGGLIRAFLEHKDRLQEILESQPDFGARMPYLVQLRDILGKDHSAPHVPTVESHLLVISEREKEVLDLVALGLTNQEIADSICVSLNTVKTHVKNLYFKLDAHTRTQAVASARSAGLI